MLYKMEDDSIMVLDFRLFPGMIHRGSCKPHHEDAVMLFTSCDDGSVPCLLLRSSAVLWGDGRVCLLGSGSSWAKHDVNAP